MGRKSKNSRELNSNLGRVCGLWFGVCGLVFVVWCLWFVVWCLVVGG